LDHLELTEENSLTTDTSEKGLETIIMRHMTGTDGLAVPPNSVAERRLPYGGSGYAITSQ
jgi:type I restriction enzyme R subunit